MSLADFEPAESFGGSNDPECEVCGKALTYSGRGRPPKFCDEHKGGKQKAPTSGGAHRSNSSVDSALSLIETTYGGVATGLLMFGAPNAAGYFSENVPAAMARNRLALEADPSLARLINRFAEKSGKGIFIGAQLSLLGPTIMLAQQERRERAALRELEQEVDAANQPYAPPQAAQTPPPAPQPARQSSAPTAAPQAAQQAKPNPLGDAVREAREGRR